MDIIELYILSEHPYVDNSKETEIRSLLIGFEKFKSDRRNNYCDVCGKKIEAHMKESESTHDFRRCCEKHVNYRRLYLIPENIK